MGFFKSRMIEILLISTFSVSVVQDDIFTHSIQNRGVAEWNETRKR